MNKILITLICLSTLSAGSLLAQTQTQKKIVPHDNPRPPEMSVPGVPETNPLPIVNYLYPDNSSKSVSQLIPKEKAIAELKKGLILKETKLERYSQFVNYRKQLGGGLLENLQIHPNRLMWVSEIDAPDGLDVPQKGGTLAHFRKSKLIIVTDAETGEPVSTDIFEVK